MTLAYVDSEDHERENKQLRARERGGGGFEV